MIQISAGAAPPIRWFSFLFLAFFLSVFGPVDSLVAQQEQSAEKKPAAENVPWLYKNSDVPIDKSWLFGELDNGLRYAVKRNGVPPGQVSIRLRVDVGALMEEDNELGFAHFIEHLSFRGSTYVPDGEAKRIWQRLGATFGSDSNAQTTPTQTVYQLDLPNATRSSLDESIRILSGMVEKPGLSRQAVDAERPVVIAELRERAGPQTRLGDATRQLFFAGQRLAKRSTVGTEDTLSNATSKGLKEFHRRWYRPENTVLAIAGDGDPRLFEQLIKKYFSKWEGRGVGGTIPDFGKPDPELQSTGVFVDPLVPQFITMITARPWEPVEDTIVYNQGILTDLLALQMINRRLEAKARAGGSYLQARVQQDDISRSVDATFVSIVPLTNDWSGALRDVRSVIADATTNAPSADDIAREYRVFESILEISAETYPTEAARKQADDIVTAVDIRETVATPQTALDIFRAMQAQLTPERLLASTQRLFKGTATRALLTSPTAIENGPVLLAEALTADVAVADNARIGQAKLGFDALPRLGRKGKIKTSRRNDKYDTEFLTLSNRVRVVLYQTKSEVNKIYVQARFGGGFREISPEERSLIWSGPLALSASGVGDLGQEEIDKITTGRRIGLTFSVDNSAYLFSAETRASDLEDQLHLMAAKLDFPKWDASPVLRSRAATLIGYDSFSASPDAVLNRDLTWLARGKDERWKTPSKPEIEALTADDFREFWQPKLSRGPVELLIFGDFERTEALDSILRTFGALKKRKKMRDVSVQQPLSFPERQDGPLILTHKGDKKRAAAVIAWPTSGGLEDIRESRILTILSSIFNDRLFEILRSQEGASYSPQVYSDWPEDFQRGGYIAVSSQLTKTDVDRFFRVADAIAKDLRETTVKEDEFNRIIEPLRQRIRRASSGNTFWMRQMTGASFDSRKLDALDTIFSDYGTITAKDVQQAAQKYLVEQKKWSLIVLPESGQ